MLEEKTEEKRRKEEEIGGEFSAIKVGRALTYRVFHISKNYKKNPHFSYKYKSHIFLEIQALTLLFYFILIYFK